MSQILLITSSPRVESYSTRVGHKLAQKLAGRPGSHLTVRDAAILLTAMYVSFTLLVHVPMLLADPSSHWIWSENALNLALIGVAWVVADSLARPPARSPGPGR